VHKRLLHQSWDRFVITRCLYREDGY
jgi:hypothetical protein